MTHDRTRHDLSIPPPILPLQNADEEKNTGLNERKHNGYPAFSKWMNSSDDFLVLRRFGQLGTRAALLLQDDLVQAEEKLDKMDQYTMSQPKGNCGSFKVDKNTIRDRHLRETIPKLKQYWEFVDALGKWKTRDEAEDDRIRNVKIWLMRHYGAIEKKEQEFIEKEGDLVTLVSRQRSLLRSFFGQCKALRRVFSLKHRQDREESSSVKYYSDRHFETFTSLAIVLGGLAMLFGPMWWLNKVGSADERLGIITGFVTLFALLLFGATTSATKGYEVLAATAAYAAVLTVFLQSNGPTSGTTSEATPSSGDNSTTMRNLTQIAASYLSLTVGK